MVFEEFLIEEVKKRNALYDKGNREYFHITKKERMWEEIAKRVGENSESCKKRWKTLRDNYTRVKKQKKNKWKYYKSLNFLDEVENKKTIKTDIYSGNLNVEQNDDDCHIDDDNHTFVSFSEPIQKGNGYNDINVVESTTISQFQRNSENSESLVQVAPNESKHERKIDKQENTETHKFYEYIAERIIKADLTDSQRGYIDMEVLSIVNASIKKFTSKKICSYKY